MIGRADIEGSKSYVAMNAWQPQASYPCGNFSDTSSLKFPKTKGSIGHAFAVCIRTENQNQPSFSPFGPHEISVLIELKIGRLRYFLTDVPPQPNSPPVCVPDADRKKLKSRRARRHSAPPGKWDDVESSGISLAVALPLILHLSSRPAQQTRVKLNRVFFPRRFFQARSLGCGFARQ